MNLRAVVIARLADGVQSAPGNLLYCNADGLLTTSPADGIFLGVHAHEGPATPARDLQVIKAAGCVPVLVHAVGGTLCREGRPEAAQITIKRATSPEDVQPLPPGEIRYLDPVDPELW